MTSGLLVPALCALLSGAARLDKLPDWAAAVARETEAQPAPGRRGRVGAPAADGARLRRRRQGAGAGAACREGPGRARAGREGAAWCPASRGRARSSSVLKGWNARPDGDVEEIARDDVVALEDGQSRLSAVAFARAMKGSLLAFESVVETEHPMGPVEVLPVVETAPVRQWSLTTRSERPGVEVSVDAQHVSPWFPRGPAPALGSLSFRDVPARPRDEAATPSDRNALPWVQVRFFDPSLHKDVPSSASWDTLASWTYAKYAAKTGSGAAVARRRRRARRVARDPRLDGRGDGLSAGLSHAGARLDPVACGRGGAPTLRRLQGPGDARDLRGPCRGPAGLPDPGAGIRGPGGRVGAAGDVRVQPRDRGGAAAGDSRPAGRGRGAARTLPARGPHGPLHGLRAVDGRARGAPAARLHREGRRLDHRAGERNAERADAAPARGEARQAVDVRGDAGGQRGRCPRRAPRGRGRRRRRCAAQGLPAVRPSRRCTLRGQEHADPSASRFRTRSLSRSNTRTRSSRPGPASGPSTSPGCQVPRGRSRGRAARGSCRSCSTSADRSISRCTSGHRGGFRP